VSELPEPDRRGGNTPQHLLDVHPALEPLAIERNLGFADWKFREHWVYPIEANWKVFVENATECYHCPTVHTKSFSDAFITDANIYELVEIGIRRRPRFGAEVWTASSVTARATSRSG